MRASLKRNFITGFLWSVFGQGGYLLVGLTANIILARILSPYEFGQIGIVMFFIIIAKVLTESGLSGALIRKEDATADDFSTVFVFNLAVSLVLMLLLVLFSGAIATFYKDAQLKEIIMASSLVLLINAFQITQTTKLIRELKFKRKGIYEFVAIFFASVIGIALAVYGAGVWSVVAMQLSTAFILTATLWIFEGTFLKLIFKKQSFKNLYRFGINTTLASLLETAFDNIYQLVLGKYFAISQSGFFFQAKKLQEVPVGVIKSTALGVVYSSLAKVQNDLALYNGMYKRIIKFFTVIVGLICLLIFFYAEHLILLLYGPEWIGAIFYLKILIVASFFYMQEAFNRITFKIFDKTEKILFLEIVKKIIQVISIVIGIVFMSLDVLLYGFLITSISSYFINYYYSRQIFGSFSWADIFSVLKVFSIAFLTYLLAVFALQLPFFESNNGFFLIPVIISIYFLQLRISGSFNLVNEAQAVLKIVRNK